MKKSKKKVAFFTTTRADFSTLSPLIDVMENCREYDALLFVGGTHLISEYGETIREIKEHNFKIIDTFDYNPKNDTSVSLSESCGLAQIKLAKIFDNYNFDLVCIVGDRFELLSIVSNAILFKKPILHLYGGEKTEGVIDEQIRHMVTKAAHLHFVSCEAYGENIRKMGEANWRIHNIGLLNIDKIVKINLIPKTQLFQELGLYEDKETVLLTYHPVTLEFKVPTSKQLKDIFDTLRPYNFQVVITAPNLEVNRNKILSVINDENSRNPNIHLFNSLGSVKYHSLIPHSKFVIGNSSSIINEVPFFRIPGINIGDRQKGRVRHRSVIDVGYSIDSIKIGIVKAISKDFRESLKDMPFKFGDGNSAGKIISILKNTIIDQDLLRK